MLLDEEFVAAHKVGMDIVFGDGVRRTLFLRVLTYSADYPEK